jgi:hypothetical protein
MRTRALIALLLQMICGAAAAAAAAGLALASRIAPRTALTGERIPRSARVRNDGPADAANVVVQLGVNATSLGLSVIAPAGWTCATGNTVVCRAASLARFSEAAFEATVLAPAETRDATVFAIVTSDTPDPNRANDQHSLPLGVTAASANAELSIAGLSPAEEVVRPGGAARVEVAVKNDGPDAARNVHLAVAFDTEIAAQAEGNGWTCTAFSARRLLCSRSSLAPGETAVAAVRFAAPNKEVATPIYAQVQAESNRETLERDNLRAATVFSGAADAWHRVLLPLTATDIPGANGSLWKTDIGVLIRSDTEIEIRPGACEFVPVTCFPPRIPLRRPFDAREAALVPDRSTPGTFLYVRAADAAKIHFSTRAYDAARSNETSGAEIPAVRDHEFRTSTISLLNLPVASDYRQTLRVYDADARAGAAVIVRLFAGDETAPHFEHVFPLAAPSPAHRTTTALLPVHPGYLQLDLGEAIALSRGEAVRVDVAPVTPGLRFWAFVSITNNRTHHVTTVTPQ